MSDVDRPLLSMNYLATVLGVPRDELERIAELANTSYTQFTEPKKHGGVRQIEAPSSELKRVQRRIKKRLLDTIELPRFMCGGIPKRSTREHARRHVRKPELATADVADFFPSVSCRQVATIWNRWFGASAQVANRLTKLTTRRGHLPHGSPASMALANLAILDAVTEVHARCRELGLDFSVYVDDVAISGEDARAALSWVPGILERYGFKVNEAKLSVMRAGERQIVGGHTVNRRISNGRARLHDIRKSVAKVLAGEIADDQDIRRVQGRVGHAWWTKPKQAEWMRSVLRKHLGRDDE